MSPVSGVPKYPHNYYFFRWFYSPTALRTRGWMPKKRKEIETKTRRERKVNGEEKQNSIAACVCVAMVIQHHVWLITFSSSSLICLLYLNAFLQLLVPLANNHQKHEIHSGMRLSCWRKYRNATGSTAGDLTLMPDHTEAETGQLTSKHLLIC